MLYIYFYILLIYIVLKIVDNFEEFMANEIHEKLQRDDQIYQNLFDELDMLIVENIVTKEEDIRLR